MATDPKNPPAPVRAFVDAAAKTDLDTMFAQVDWQASRAGAWAASLDSPALASDRAPQLIASGFDEFEKLNVDLVRSNLGQIALHIAGQSTVRPASDDERASMVEALEVPAVARTLPPEIATRLGEWRARAAQVGDVWVVETMQARYGLAVTADGTKVMLQQLTTPAPA